MCRLLGYATAGHDISLRKVLGEQALETYRDLSEIHNDGWGAALLSEPVQTPDVDNGGEPTPETGSRLYKSTTEALLDPVFEELADVPARGALWHLRLASSHIPLVLENQHPFYAQGLSFTHNGDISDDDGRNVVVNREFPVNRDLLRTTGGHSDSAIFFAVILEYIGLGLTLDEAVVQAVRELRKTYPKSSYNCMVQSEDEFIVLRASKRHEVPPRIVEIYHEKGRVDDPDDYRLVRYRPIRDDGGASVGVVAASSGFEQDPGDGWRVLGNDQLLVASNHTGAYRIRDLEDPSYETA